MPQLRQNIITGDWVVIAPERAKRPQDFVTPKSVKVAKKENCPFCEESQFFSQNKKVRHTFGKYTYIVENKFPAFVRDKDEQSVRSFYPESGFYRAKPSIGEHEVIVIKDHELYLPKFPLVVFNEMLEAMRERYLWFKKHDNVVSIMPIYNHGPEAGASIDHPHAQIFASGIVSNTVGKEIEGADNYYGVNGVCVYCDIIKHELMEKIRIVYQNDHFLAVTFFASRFPFETWIMPKKHESQFENTSKASMSALADCLQTTLKMLDKTLDNPSLNFYIHTLPTITDNSASYHWHLEIVPRVSNYGGFELGSGVIINVMSPEEAAEYLKK